MGLFKKNKQEMKRGSEVPLLPELPSLPEFPEFEKSKITPISKLPDYPSDSFENFSQNNVNAVSGEEEGDEEAWNADEFARNQDMQMMREPLEKISMKKFTMQEIPEPFTEAAKIVKKTEPLFIRIDKFEESLNSFEKIKTKIIEIDKILRDTKKIKEEEERELIAWEREIQTIKKQIEKIDRDIFSKVE